MKAKVLSVDGQEKSEIQLPALFETEVKDHVLYEAVKSYLANQRQGTSKAKSRSEVSGGGEKPFRQKGTGRARAGTNTSPLWVRGSKAHGPNPRSYRTSLNKKVKKSALKMALSLKAKENKVKVLNVISFETPKTKNMKALLDAVKVEKKILLILDKPDANIFLSGRNLKGLKIKQAGELNVFDVLNCEQMIITEEAVGKLKEVLEK